MATNDNWYTPIDIIRAVKEVLGEINFDPASCEEANKAINANIYLTSDNAEDYRDKWGTALNLFYSGKIKPTVFVNPPSNMTADGIPWTNAFWDLLTESGRGRSISDGIFIAFNLEFLRTSQGGKKFGPTIHNPLSYTMCIPRKRLAFVGAGNNPRYANAIFYVPGSLDRSKKFVEVFSKIGQVRRNRG
jgi:hypothetical protein